MFPSISGHSLVQPGFSEHFHSPPTPGLPEHVTLSVSPGELDNVGQTLLFMAGGRANFPSLTLI